MDPAAMRIQLVTSHLNRELPVNQDTFGIPFSNKSQDLVAQYIDGRDASLETVSGNGREFDLDPVEPTGRLGRVDKLKLLGQGKGFFGRQVLVESTSLMRIEIILNEPNRLGFGPASDHGLTEESVLLFGASWIDFCQPFTSQRFYCGQ